MAFNSFDVNLFNKLSEENDNILFSPLSISLAVTLLLLGSDETARQQLESALGIVKHEELLVTFKELKSNSEDFIKLVSAVFPSATSPMWENFLNKTVYAFKPIIQNMDYENTEQSN